MHGTNQRTHCERVSDRLQGILIPASLETENGAEAFMQPPPRILTSAFAFCFNQKDRKESKQRLLHYAEEHVMNDENSIIFIFHRLLHGCILKF